MIVNRNDIADIFGVAKTTVDAWVKKGCPVLEKPGRGKTSKYDSAAVHKWLLMGKEDLDLQEERAKLAVEQTRQKKRENDIEEGLIAPVDLLSEVLSDVCQQIASTLDAIPL